MIEYLSIIAIGLSAFAIYYARDIAEKVKGRFFELKDETEESLNELQNLKKEIQERIDELRAELEGIRKTESGSAEEWRIKSLSEKVAKLDNLVKEHLKNLENKNVKIEHELETLKKEVQGLRDDLIELNRAVLEDRENLKAQLKEELLSEVEEEIERLEELIERRKEEEVEEFLDILKTAITMDPEKISSGLLEAKRALLSLRDIAKVYVLTGKGRDEFLALKENLLGLLKNLRKLVIVSVPDEDIYSKFRDVIIEVKRLDLPMKDEKSGKELNPERSFIEIHKLIYKLAGDIDEIASMINEPVPVTPVEKEFYEKLRYQFEELRKLEKQVEMLMARLGENLPEASTEKDEKREIEDLLRDLGV
ncbi:coiled-coil domain-containing protein [Thermococcus peptonophilus]|uniref:DNA double-strand break repair Rad50 ATPase n=1 Tax=Thermococcus peptonophilus TaxID=53952 RepID=A0A142CSP9_9EURY|nr:hypothetical protein [Thermococcus peptonophilus]AMQ17801.1 hypothetical protein A0127_00735 [Thermococcus peptonophilus]